MMANGNNEVWTVEYWREEFVKVRADMPSRWRQALANHNSFFNTKQGADMMDQVADGRASLEKTARVVQACNEYLQADYRKIEPSIERSLSRSGITYQPKYEATKRLQQKMEESKK